MYSLIFFSVIFLSNREKYKNVIENRVLNIIIVIFWNVCCYISVIIPSDPSIIPQPAFINSLFTIIFFLIIGILILIFGIFLVAKTGLMRKSIGYENTESGLITTGLYQYFRHPIYAGISLITLSLPFLLLNTDAFLIYPLILTVNFIQGKIEEKFDMVTRFGKEYEQYKKNTHAFGPIWLWIIILGGLIFIDILIFLF